MTRSTIWLSAILLIAATPGLTLAALPPELLNYQGVLRDAADRPLDGDHDMIFRFFSAETSGDEILIDRHTTADGAPVTVQGGLFSVRLGGGAVEDGSGPGFYASFANLFRDYSGVWLQVEVDGEALDPRVRVASAAYAFNATRLEGRNASQFIDTSTTFQAKSGPLYVVAMVDQFALEGEGQRGGGYFWDNDQTGEAFVGYQDLGIVARGSEAGGYFNDEDSGGLAYVGYGTTGIHAGGYTEGGYFYDRNDTGHAYVGYGDHGIEAYGQLAGGLFEDTNQSGYAHVAYGDRGIRALGDQMGGSFQDRDDLAFSYVGYGNRGIHSEGTEAGGYFRDDDDTGYAWVGYGHRGIEAFGESGGGYFSDSDNSGYAILGFGDYGAWAHGNVAGGFFSDLNSGGYSYAGYGTYKISGSGGVSFVQNHPDDPDRVIVYTAPEGDEAATYTRGTARLVGGEARVALGETFKWVTNPDIGLTAHLTPRDDCRGLYVASLTTTEMIVRERDGGTSDAVFDYLVFGLRIGFEETSVVQEKTIESLIPSMKSHRERYERSPELRRFNALERFREMVADAEGRDHLDLSRAEALRAAIQEYDPEIHGPVESLLGHGPGKSDAGDSDDGASTSGPSVTEADEVTAGPESVANVTGAVPIVYSERGSTESSPREADALSPRSWNEVWMPVSEPVEAGDVLVLDPERPGLLRPAEAMADATVAGIAVGPSRGVDVDRDSEVLRARVALGGLVECKVDAGYGAIRLGDPLTTSPTPGHAMRALEVVPGTILGKSAEPLDAGLGTIKIVVMPR